MSKPIFAYDNLMTTGTVTATSSDADFPVSNLTNWKPARFWKPATTGTFYINIDAGSAIDVDYFGVFSHDLTEKSATVKLQWSNDGATGWTDLTAALQKSDSEVIFRTFTSVNKRYFRVEVVATTSVCAIGVIGIGEYLTMERGITPPFIPPHLDTRNKYLINIADEGLPLGTSVLSRAARLSVSIKLLSPSWVRTNWEPLLDHAELNPLFFSWDDENYQDEAVFTQLDVTRSRISYRDPLFMDVKAEGKAWHTL